MSMTNSKTRPGHFLQKGLTAGGPVTADHFRRFWIRRVMAMGGPRLDYQADAGAQRQGMGRCWWSSQPFPGAMTGLNTVIPFGDDALPSRADRASVLSPRSVLKIDD